MSELAMAGAHGGSDTDLDRAQGLVDERGDQTLRGAFLWGPCWICWMFPHAYHAYHGQDLISQDILVPAWHVPGRLRSCLAEMRMWMWSPTNRCSSQWQLQALWTFTAQFPWKLTWKEADNMINMTAWKGNMHQASIVSIIILGSCLRFRAGTVPDSACQLPSHSRRSVWLDCGCGRAAAICGGPFLLVGKDAVAQTVVSGFGGVKLFAPQFACKGIIESSPQTHSSFAFVDLVVFFFRNSLPRVVSSLRVKVNQQGSPGSAMLMTEVLEGSRVVQVVRGQQTSPCLAYARRQDTYQALGVEPSGTRKLEEYIGEYYRTWRVK